MQVIDCETAHLEAMRAIVNDVIAHTTALYEFEPRSPQAMRAWWDSRHHDGWPVVGVLDTSDQLLGFGSFGPFRAQPAYQYTVEHSLYVARDHRGRGIGRLLLQTLIDRAVARHLHVMVGGIDADNAPSIALHERMGFRRVATMPQVARKFDRWLDLLLYQRTLDTRSPACP
jgi:L-amino acid N-acyltransferase YncA